MHITTVKTGYVRCKPSVLGWLFMSMTLLGWTMSVNYNNNLLYLLVFMMLSLMLVSLVLGWINFSNIKIAGINTHSAFAGDKLHLEFNVINNNFSIAEALFISHTGTNSVRNHGVINEEQVDIPVGAIRVLNLKTSVHHRGCINLLPINLASLYPIGLFVFYRPVRSDVNEWVYPEPVGEHLLEEFIGQDSFKSGIEADEMKTLRPYQASDSLSRINWKAYARSDELMTSEYDGGVSIPSMILDEESLKGLELEERMSQLAKWVLEAENMQGEYGLKLGQTFIDASKGKLHEQACLTALAKYQQVPNDSEVKKSIQKNLKSWFSRSGKIKHKLDNEVRT